MSKVAIQGFAASFHEVAANTLLAKQPHSFIYCETFADVFAAVAQGRATYGVVAIQNSNYGPIAESRALLARPSVRQIQTLTMRIKQCLLVVPGTTPDEITEVYSHPIALVQCSRYLKQFLPQAKLVEHADTAGSAEDVARRGDKSKASIASSAAADLYGLEVLEDGIENDKNNATTFTLFRAA